MRNVDAHGYPSTSRWKILGILALARNLLDPPRKDARDGHFMRLAALALSSADDQTRAQPARAVVQVRETQG